MINNLSITDNFSLNIFDLKKSKENSIIRKIFKLSNKLPATNVIGINNSNMFKKNSFLMTIKR
tara:strand:- start:92 stop:280 length:189 start_codon:yes stop_codon:yes gene_type:complete